MNFAGLRYTAYTNRFDLKLIVLFLLFFAYEPVKSESIAKDEEPFVVDTFTCVGSSITLYWPIRSDMPYAKEEYSFAAPIETLICRSSVENNGAEECWRLKVYPEPPKRRLTIELLDVTETGEMNLLICFWKAEVKQPASCFPICRIESLRCQSTMEICNGIKESGSLPLPNTVPATFCTTIVNDRKCD